MSKVIRFPSNPKKGEFFRNRELLCFRSAPWATQTPAMVGLHQAALLEEHREEAGQSGQPLSFVPSHLTLRGGPGQTLGALYHNRGRAAVMHRVYLLAGMMELATRLSHDLLRTDLIHRLFDNIRAFSLELGLRWVSGREGFLLPLPESLYPGSRLAHELAKAGTFKELMQTLEQETKAHLELAGANFVFYLPRTWTGPAA